MKTKSQQTTVFHIHASVAYPSGDELIGNAPEIEVRCASSGPLHTMSRSTLEEVVRRIRQDAYMFTIPQEPAPIGGGPGGGKMPVAKTG